MNHTPAQKHPSGPKECVWQLLLLDPLEHLAARSRRLADLVESTSRRRDVRILRARLLTLLMELRCPPRGALKRAWYVAGAVARTGIEALRRAWRGFFGSEPPCPRTLRSHLGVLERVLAIIRQPGEWIATADPSSTWRPRHADTLHLIEDEETLALWLANGAEGARKHPEARRNPDLWRRYVGAWRRRRATQLELYPEPEKAFGTSIKRPEHPEGLPDRIGAGREDGKRLADELAKHERDRSVEVLDTLSALARAGCRFVGRISFQLAADRRRVLGAAAMLAHALMRGDAIRNRAAWLLRAWRHAPRWELERRRVEILSRGGGP